MGLDRLSARLAELKFSDIPPQTVEKARIAVLNFLSGSLPGADADLVQAEKRIWETQGGTGNCVMIAQSGRSAPLAAAAVNAAMGQIFLQEDCHEHTISHPGVIVIPVALALGQSSGASGQDLITAVLCGYEAQGKIGKGLIREGFPRNGMRPASVLAPFGAAAAAAKMLGLNAEGFRNALSIAANAAGGVMEFSVTGTPEISIQNANGAKNGMLAALLASQGIQGAISALDGRFGVGLAFNNAECDWGVLDETDGFEIDETFIKIYPGCGHVLPTAQGIIDILSRRRFAPDEVEKVVVGVSANGGSFPGVNNPGPYGGTISAMMSHQFMVAAAVCLGAVDIAAVKRFDDPQLASFAQKVAVVTDAEIESKKIIGARVSVQLKNGETIESFQDDTVPQTEEGVIARTRVFARPYFDEARVENMLAKAAILPELTDIGELMELFAG